MALISLEDLEGLDEEELDDDITDNPEPMDEEERQRLLTHWQAVASTHQVSVPPGEGAGPAGSGANNTTYRSQNGCRCLLFTTFTTGQKQEVTNDSFFLCYRNDRTHPGNDP